MRLFVKLVLLVILVVSAVAGWLWNDYRTFLDEPILAAGKTHRVIIPVGQSFTALTQALPLQHGAHAARLLEFHGRRTGRAGSIKAGEYDLQADWTPDELLDHLVSGRVVQHALTIIEGQTFAQLVALVFRNDVLVHRLRGKSADAIMAAIGADGVHPEGRFLPDTYHFPRGTTDQQFLRRAYQAMQRKLTQAWEARAASVPLKTPDEALILASIIEKETALGSERTLIAGVFARRLQKDMRLETDPTVIYGMGERFDGNLRRADLRADTPYNTYTRKGLPPTPIALPGVDAIRAALNPADGDAIFFVAKGDGSHHFSATYAEHKRAVREYQIRRKRTVNSEAGR